MSSPAQPTLPQPTPVPWWKSKRVVTRASVVVLAVVVWLVGNQQTNHGIKESEGFRMAMAAVRANPRIIAALGEPINTGRIFQSRVTFQGNVWITAAPAKSFAAEVPLSGPKGSATLSISTSVQSDAWEFKNLRVSIAGNGENIDLRDEVKQRR